MSVDIQIKCLLFLSGFKQNWKALTGFRKSFQLILHKQPSGGSRVFPCEHKMDRRTADKNVRLVDIDKFSSYLSSYDKIKVQCLH